MQPEEHNQFAERWLDEALVHYSEAEPRSGFEARIRANLAAAEKRRPVWHSGPVIAFACAAVLILAIGVAMLRQTKVSSGSSVVVVQSPSTPQPTVASTAPIVSAPPERGKRPPRTVRRPTPSVVADKEPRQPKFPSAMPLSGQESLVVAYIASTPIQELMNVAAEQREWQERMDNEAKAADAQQTPPEPDINHLRFPPLEGGNTQAGNAEAR